MTKKLRSSCSEAHLKMWGEEPWTETQGHRPRPAPAGPAVSTRRHSLRSHPGSGMGFCSLWLLSCSCSHQGTHVFWSGGDPVMPGPLRKPLGMQESTETLQGDPPQALSVRKSHRPSRVLCPSVSLLLRSMPLSPDPQSCFCLTLLQVLQNTTVQLPS